jgi:hypothetical protein
VKRVIRSVALTVFVVVVVWGLYNRAQLAEFRSRSETHSVTRLHGLGLSIQDGLRSKGELPPDEEALWRFLAGGTPVEANLPSLCRNGDGELFHYRRLSSNTFVVSFNGLHGAVEYVCDATNTTLRFPEWRQWNEFTGNP